MAWAYRSGTAWPGWQSAGQSGIPAAASACPVRFATREHTAAAFSDRRTARHESGQAAIERRACVNEQHTHIGQEWQSNQARLECTYSKFADALQGDQHKATAAAEQDPAELELHNTDSVEQTRRHREHARRERQCRQPDTDGQGVNGKKGAMSTTPSRTMRANRDAQWQGSW